MLTRDLIVDTARTYLDTPFGDKGRVKGVALDCVGLPLMIAGELGILDKDGVPLNGGCYTTYSAQPVGTLVHDLCMKHLLYKPVRKMEPGDVLTINMATAPCHVAIVGDMDGRPSLIHAYSGGINKCVEHPIDQRWQRRIVGCFAFPGVK